MSHLSIDRLAALADEQPTSEERLHLAECSNCAREVDAHRSLRAIAGSERDAAQLPLTRWDTLSERLRDEGLLGPVRSGEVGSGKRIMGFHRLLRGHAPTSHSLLRFAAALVLVAGGAVAGRASVGATLLPGGLTGQETTATARVSADSLPTTFASAEEALRWKNFYHDAYQSAVSFLASSAGDSVTGAAGTPAVMRARLSALDQVNRTMRQALDEAPFDPVINDFYLTAFGQREAALRQLNSVLPQGVRLNSF